MQIYSGAFIKMKNRNSKVLKDFVKYCKEHPEERFWQALRNWSGHAFIFAGKEWLLARDTFYFEGKNK